jgi:hypothetical protein
MKAVFRWSCWAVACAVLLIKVDIAAAANKYVVIAADPPIASLPLGYVVKVDDQIDVPAGALLTLLGDDGTVTTVGGPQRLVVTAEPESDSAEAIRTRTTFQRISDLLLGSPDDGEVLGGRRSVGQSSAGQEPLDPWALPVQHPGEGCLQSGDVTLRRAGSLKETPVGVTVNGTKVMTGSIWAGGQAILHLPTVGVDEAKTLEIKLGDQTVRFTIHMLPAEIKPNQGMDVLAWMLETGCKVQAMSFARWLSGR